MAENEDGQEKSEQPTPKKREDSRKKGQTARSRELNTMSVMLIGGVALVGMSRPMGEGLMRIMADGFTISRAEIFDPNALVNRLVTAIGKALMMLAPFFAVMVAVAVISSVLLGGLAFSTQAMAPKLSKLNPIKGLGRIFSLKGLLELFKAMAKFLLVGGATGLMLWFSIGDFIMLSSMELGPAVAELGNLVGWSFVMISSTLIIIAMIDVPFQLWDNTRQLKMTKQEVREEMKNTEGRPEVKGRIRNLQREMAQRRMMEEVPKADVIVTNPTHYAVALRYDQQTMPAPKLVAKGAGLVAANIRQVASEHGVPIVQSPMLARAIHTHAELGDVIPAGLYMSVAKLLAYVYQLHSYQRDGRPKPRIPDELPVPEELQVAADEGQTQEGAG